ncbi:MAG: hypothetical protein AB7G17_08410 [Phycisphaerales bacterium]
MMIWRGGDTDSFHPLQHIGRADLPDGYADFDVAKGGGQDGSGPIAPILRGNGRETGERFRRLDASSNHAFQHICLNHVLAPLDLGEEETPVTPGFHSPAEGQPKSTPPIWRGPVGSDEF